jgi:hypothetical protein
VDPGEVAVHQPDEVVERLVRAVADRDLDAVADCFAEEYRNETPVHPARSFGGRAQVRRNWAQILGGVPDLVATVVRRAVVGDEVWTEWEQRGTRPDGSELLLRGVVIFGVAGDRIAWARFYLEPVDPADLHVDDVDDGDAAVRRHVTGGPA